MQRYERAKTLRRNELKSISDVFIAAGKAISDEVDVMADKDIDILKVLHGTPVQEMAEGTLEDFLSDLRKKVRMAVQAKEKAKRAAERKKHR